MLLIVLVVHYSWSSWYEKYPLFGRFPQLSHFTNTKQRRWSPDFWSINIKYKPLNMNEITESFPLFGSNKRVAFRGSCPSQTSQHVNHFNPLKVMKGHSLHKVYVWDTNFHDPKKIQQKSWKHISTAWQVHQLSSRMWTEKMLVVRQVFLVSSNMCT